MGWFDEQIRQRKLSDQEVFEESILRMASVVLGKERAGILDDERIITKVAVDDILKYYRAKPVEIPPTVQTPEEALVREIREELDTEISVDRFLHTVDWDYPKVHLTMHCFMCSLKTEALHLNEHEAARWLGKEDIHSVKWLPADEGLLPMILHELG